MGSAESIDWYDRHLYMVFNLAMRLLRWAVRSYGTFQ